MASDLHILPELKRRFIERIEEAGGSVADEDDYSSDMIDIVICRFRSGPLYTQVRYPYEDMIISFAHLKLSFDSVFIHPGFRLKSIGISGWKDSCISRLAPSFASDGNTAITQSIPASLPNTQRPYCRNDRVGMYS